MEDNKIKDLKYKMQTLSDLQEMLLEITHNNQDDSIIELQNIYNKIESNYMNGIATVEEIDKAIEIFFSTLVEIVDDKNIKIKGEEKDEIRK